MFVPYKPVSSLDVYRNSENCVCGATSVVTNKGGEHHGYCNECTRKREMFANNIINKISLDQDEIIDYAILSVLENIRITILKERIYYLIDTYYSENQNNETFKEPYKEPEFKLKVYREKIRIQTEFLKNIPYLEIAKKFSYNKKEQISIIYNFYYKRIENQIEYDKNNVNALCNEISQQKKLTKDKGTVRVIV